MIIRKVVLSISFFCCSSVFAMKQFSKAAEARFIEGLNRHVTLGSKLANSENNGVLKVCKDMQKQLENKAPHQLPDWSRAQELLGKIAQDERYKTAFDSAKKKQEDQEWSKFRKAAAHLLADVVESKTKLKYNRGQEKWKELFDNNHDLDPQSADAHYFKASMIALFGLYDIKEEAKKAS